MSRVSVTMNKPENDRKTLMARGIVAMLLLSTLVQILSQTLIDDPDDIGESMEPNGLPPSMYAQSYDVGNQSRGGYHLASGEWWEPPHQIEVTTSDWDGDGTSNSLDTHPLNPAIPFNSATKCFVPMANCNSSAQGFIADAFPTWESPESLWAQDVAVGDIDGDGDLDLVIGFMESSSVAEKDKVYLNENGSFSQIAHWSSPSYTTRSVALGDIDGDGDLDLAIGTHGNNYLFLNDGGNFSSSYDWVSSDSKKSTAVEFGDVDGDGDLDLVVGNGDSAALVNQVFFNTNGVLSATAGWSSSDSKKTMDIALGDIDGDGNIDLVIANKADYAQIFFNTGSGFSTTADTGWDPSLSQAYAVGLGDYDGDGDLDVILGQAKANLYINSGGTLGDDAAWSGTSDLRNRALTWGDIDGDGDLDLVVGQGCCGSVVQPMEIYTNLDGELESSPSWSPDNNAVTTAVTLGDLDGDGRLDLVRANVNEPVEIYFNRGGSLESTIAWDSNEESNSRGLSWGDMDGDGDLDLAVANIGDKVQVYLNDGSTLSNSADWESSSSVNALDVEWGDVDADGDLDLVVGKTGTNQIYFNSGTNLSTSAGWTSSDSKNTYAIQLGDIDKDGDVDLIVGNYGSNAQIFFNSGSAISTTAGWSSSSTMKINDLDIGDIDGDGNLDLIVGGFGTYSDGISSSTFGNSYVFYGTGSTLSTTPGWTSASTAKTSAIELGDFDGDGDLDLFQGNWLAYDYIFLNSGTGLSTSYSYTVGSGTDRTEGADIADIDGDGDLDIVKALMSVENELYINVGGDFYLAWKSSNAESGRAVAIADFNGDGVLDLGTANHNGVNQLVLGALDSDRDWYSDSDDDMDQDPTQYSDTDNDGYGDTANGWTPDDCTGYWGDSWRDRIGCPDEDGDGQSNLNDDFWRKDTQWVDTDGDGRGDNWGNSSWDAGRSGAWPGQYIANAYLQDPYPLDYDNDGFEESALSGAVAPFDNCPFVYGLSTEDVNGCPDSDGDGYSDISDSHSGDQTQWSDTDNDGYGDNWGDGAWNQSRAGGVGQWIQSASSPDNCPTSWGNSTVDYFGCTDNDGDGYSSLTDVDDNDGNDWNDADNDGFGDNADQCPFSWGNITSSSDKGCPDTDADGHADRSDDLPNDATQWTDSDDDGYGDNIAGNTPDACKDERGTSTRGVSAGVNTTKYGCADSDSDSYANTDDPCPFSYGNSWVDRFACPDSDQDGISDNVDPYPNNKTSDIEDWDDDGFLDHSSGSNTDAFPADNTQNTDTDGDGHGDNANGNSGDQFLNESTQWQDSDGDGYGDNQAPGAFEPDRCPSTNGTSTTDRFGCTDTDGDGYSDATPGYFVHPQGQADSHPNNVSQYRDKDGDGYGDNPSGVYPDSCDNNHGTSTRRVSLSGANETWYGCPDADGDSYEDQSDPCKNQFGNSWVDQFACPDADQDGISDEADPYPNTATSNTNDWDDDGVININDAFPADNTQNTDTDGDGHGDNASGNSGDQFLHDITQWQDSDGDGYGDNQAPGAFEPDRCPSTNGTSTTDRFGCTDTDGDGYSDSTPGYFAHPQGLADSHPNNVSQYRDKDGDGYGDNPAGVYPDSCENNHGTSTRKILLSGANQTWYGCPDADGDSYEDQSDPCQNQFGNSWVDQMGCPDSDQDGISDGNDPYPNTATSNTDDWDDDGVININDAFPADRSQSQDTDGDGFGDDSTGSNPDAFVNEISQWSDLDGDGYGDNPVGVDADDCSYTAGTSTRDRLGCPDNDGDGWSNPDSAWNSAYGADAFIDDATQWKDEDGDGYGDNVNGSEPDDCSKQAGTSTMKVVNGANITWLGCIDTDGDGYHDASDPCPFQFGNSWVDRMGCPDSDQDGISDGNDPYPEDATTSIDDYDGDGVANDVDDFPADRTQSQDADGDGYGDDPDGDSPDAFPDDISQWQDSDNDGYGDNMDGVEPDECIYEAGNSTDPVYGCIDTDGDGAADDYDDFPRDPTQQLDSDGDGYGDDGDTNQTDDCPYEMGDSTLGKIGCPDSDGDGWSDDDDECPDQYGNSGEPFTGCLDRDGDNVADIVDIFPDDSNESTDFDGDGIGDASDIYPFDFDNDNVTTELDWDDNDPNEHIDSDNDGVGDNADVWPMQSEIWSDVDGDGWADQFGHLLTDDCPSIPGTSTKFMHGCSDIDFDGMPDLLDPDIDGDGITNDNEMDASTPDIEYDPFDNESTPSDMDGDGIPDKMDKDTDGDGFPNELEKERGSDHNDGTKTPFNQYGDQDTGLFYIPGEGFKSKYDPNGVEISVSAMLDMVTSEYLLPLLMIPITIFALLRKGRRYKKMRKTIENCEDPDILSEYEEGIDLVIMKKKVKVEHGMLLRNLFERKRDAFDSKKSIPGLKQSGAGGGGGQGGQNEPQQGPQGPSSGPRRHIPKGGQQERKW